jgi:hypothetical protein
MPSIAALTVASSTSESRTVQPLAAATWAMPAPMVPAPRMPTVFVEPLTFP